MMKDLVDLLALEEKRLKAKILLSFNSTPFVSAVWTVTMICCLTSKNSSFYIPYKLKQLKLKQHTLLLQFCTFSIQPLPLWKMIFQTTQGLDHLPLLFPSTNPPLHITNSPPKPIVILQDHDPRGDGNHLTFKLYSLNQWFSTGCRLYFLWINLSAVA